MQSTRSSQRWLRGFFLVILAGAPALAASAEPPAITSLNPDAARAGGAEFSLTIHGENFTPASTAAFGANDLTTAFVSATELVAAIPASLIAGAGAFSVTVRTGGGASAGATFTVHPPEAAITGLSTAIRTASFVFSTRAGALRAVRPPAPPPVAITSQSSASAAVNTNVTTPISSSANLPSAANSNNTSDSLSMSFVGAATPTFAFVTGVPPAITSLTPASVLSSSGAFTMTINGANFISGKNASVARWNYTALATNYVSSSQLTAIVPASVISAGAVNITVVTSSGTSPSFGFTVNLAPPVITTESPSKLYVNNGAFMLYVYGNYFTSSAVVNWGGTPLTTTQIGGGSLTAIVPASLMATAGSVSITVSTAGGTSNSISFNVMALPPTITSLSPASVAAGSAQFSLTVNGTNFTPNSTSLVRLGTAYLGTTYVSATQLKGLVTASMMTTAGTVNVAVIQGGGVTSMAFPFTINPAPPKVSTLTP
ncbi:MAG: IPT/TIG domain-containing protein, partial [Terracidiphilus sp.]